MNSRSFNVRCVLVVKHRIFGVRQHLSSTTDSRVLGRLPGLGLIPPPWKIATIPSRVAHGVEWTGRMVLVFLLRWWWLPFCALRLETKVRFVGTSHSLYVTSGSEAAIPLWPEQLSDQSRQRKRVRVSSPIQSVHCRTSAGLRTGNTHA